MQLSITISLFCSAIFIRAFHTYAQNTDSVKSKDTEMPTRVNNSDAGEALETRYKFDKETIKITSCTLESDFDDPPNLTCDDTNDQHATTRGDMDVDSCCLREEYDAFDSAAHSKLEGCSRFSMHAGPPDHPCQQVITATRRDDRLAGVSITGASVGGSRGSGGGRAPSGADNSTSHEAPRKRLVRASLYTAADSDGDLYQIQAGRRGPEIAQRPCETGIYPSAWLQEGK